MKIAILSDIHGNLPALEVVMKEISKHKIDRVFILGDLLGYYYQAQDVFEVLDSYLEDTIIGNHEILFLDYLNGINKNEINHKYGLSYKYYKETFSQELISKIKKLPSKKRENINGISILFTHSNPIEEDGYIYPDEKLDVLERIETNQFDYIFMGHTHYPMIYNGKKTTIINVGSVGQSRVKGGIANWGVFNTINKVYTAQNTPYNINKTIENLAFHNEEKAYLINILKR